MSNWEDNYRRKDGVEVIDVGGAFAVQYNDEVIRTCPCCDRVMQTVVAAQLVADTVLPFPYGPEWERF